MIYSQNKLVYASLCGADAKLSAIGTLTLVEDSLTELMGLLKIDGLTAMHKYNAILVFVKNHVKFFKEVDWNENIVVESFISSISNIRFYIDTCIKNQKEEVVAYSRVELCGIDLNTKRIRKLDSVGFNENIKPETPLLKIEFNKKEQVELSFIEDVKVRTSNIDYIHHTNNIEYIRFLINTISLDEIINHPIKEMEINYLNQSYENDVLSIFSKKENSRTIFEIRNKEQQIIRCEMKF